MANSRDKSIRLFLDVERGLLTERQPSEVLTRWYLATSGGVDRRRQPLGRLVCDYRFNEPVELVGPMRLHLWVAALDSDDADLFVGIQKLDRDGQLVTFPHYAQYDDGPVALGWLRASHRALDPVRSTELQPFHRHEQEEKLRPGEPVAVDIEIWPSGTRFEAGETLRLIVQGRDIQEYSPGRVYARHEATVHRGRHLVLSGGPYDSYLVVPVVVGLNVSKQPDYGQSDRLSDGWASLQPLAALCGGYLPPYTGSGDERRGSQKLHCDAKSGNHSERASQDSSWHLLESSVGRRSVNGAATKSQRTRLTAYPSEVG